MHPMNPDRDIAHLEHAAEAPTKTSAAHKNTFSAASEN